MKIWPVNVILFITVSLDGFIADQESSISWFDEYNIVDGVCRYNDFIDSVDALAMGSNTYKYILNLGPWCFDGKMSYIFSDTDTPVIDNKYVKLVGSDVVHFMHTLHLAGIKRLWLVGGAQLIESFYDRNLIHQYVVNIVPKKLGQGIPLPKRLLAAKDFQLIKTTELHLGLVQKWYKKR